MLSTRRENILQLLPSVRCRKTLRLSRRWLWVAFSVCIFIFSISSISLFNSTDDDDTTQTIPLLSFALFRLFFSFSFFYQKVKEGIFQPSNSSSPYFFFTRKHLQNDRRRTSPTRKKRDAMIWERIKIIFKRRKILENILKIFKFSLEHNFNTFFTIFFR